MQPNIFNWNIYSIQVKFFLRDLKSLLLFWEGNVQVTMSKDVVERLKKAASSSSEFEIYGHILFEENDKKNIPYIDIIYDINTGRILVIECYDENSRKIINLLINGSRELRLEQRSKKV